MTRARDMVRTFNKYVLNPVMLHFAGRRHWYAAAIRHTGRRSGKHYATPVIADPVPDGFVIPLPYGTDVDWLRNVMAAAGATLTVRGDTFDVIEPTIVDAATAAPQLSQRRREAWQRLGIDSYLKVKIAT
ncbi:nitroreductase [Mycolicibacterium holsaticum]|uniref:nitroreductase n=1 Tax=Mycolicibacterium holsaticum TaxID=152142 RepID=UPI001C7CC7DA|nr:nitroreductase [Mycolicibacterium holsaticum]QZA10531.1 nitroreductase [Mycolicibacterium holsaticum DSM 44478 = JCM 12374]UNC11965.1 nitroreductase [Mycolicibacterium holsaticum DSM 44478 = JCM 12374]